MRPSDRLLEMQLILSLGVSASSPVVGCELPVTKTALGVSEADVVAIDKALSSTSGGIFPCVHSPEKQIARATATLFIFSLMMMMTE